MTGLSLSDDQLERLQEVCSDLEDAYVGPYGTVRQEEAIEYLLDTYTPPDEAENAPTSVTDGSDSGDAEGDDAEADAESDAASGKARLQAMMNILDDYDEKWSEGDGDARYVVDLPDGDTESARTKDDVKRILFQHYH